MNTSAIAVASSNITGRVSAPTDLIAREWAKPVVCFTVTDHVEEHFALDLNHPITGGKVALVMGENSYVARDSYGRRGCLYKMDGGKALVRRAEIEFFETQGGKRFPLLRRLDNEDPKFILAHVRFGFRKANEKAGFENLWSDVRGGQKIGKTDREDAEALVELKEGQVLTIFYRDGAVAKIPYTDFGALASNGGKVTMLGAEDALSERLDNIAETLNRASTLEGDARAKKEDGALHGLASLILMTKNHSELRGKIMAKVEWHAGRMRNAVRNHFERSPTSIGDTTIYSWLPEREVATVNVTRGGPVRYGDPLPSPVLDAIKAADAKKVDGMLHGMISEAIKGIRTWASVRDEFKRRSLAGEFRPGVRHRFCLQCTDSAITDEVSKYPVAVKDNDKRGPSPLGNKTMTKEKLVAYEKRRDEGRGKREHPARGSSPAADPHGKGKGKQKNDKGRKH